VSWTKTKAWLGATDEPRWLRLLIGALIPAAILLTGLLYQQRQQALTANLALGTDIAAASARLLSGADDLASGRVDNSGTNVGGHNAVVEATYNTDRDAWNIASGSIAIRLAGRARAAASWKMFSTAALDYLGLAADTAFRARYFVGAKGYITGLSGCGTSLPADWAVVAVPRKLPDSKFYRAYTRLGAAFQCAAEQQTKPLV
jgi:hypothetical protein